METELNTYIVEVLSWLEELGADQTVTIEKRPSIIDIQADITDWIEKEENRAKLRQAVSTMLIQKHKPSITIFEDRKILYLSLFIQ